VREVLDAVRAVTGRRVPARLGPRRAGDPVALVADPEPIRNDLGFEPAHRDLSEIVESAWRFVLATRR
jgi:UDP-glucose 4-epimerase